MGLEMLQELLRADVEVDLYLNTELSGLPEELRGFDELRIIVRRSGWRWDKWYSRHTVTALLSNLAARSFNGTLLSVRLLIEHRRRSYDAVFQLSQTELLLLGRLRRWAPPIVVHPCSHAAGELRWHARESAYARRTESARFHHLVRAWLKFRARLQPTQLERADLVVGPSNEFVRLLHEDYAVPTERTRVLRHMVDLERFTVSDEPRAAPAELLFVSRISARKGLEDIVALSWRLVDLDGRAVIKIIGGTTLWSDYSEHLSDLAPGVTEVLGGVPAREMPALLRSATALLVPSRYEPGSIVTGEALASGLPVVASNAVGPSEFLTSPSGAVYDCGDIDALEAAVRTLVDTTDKEWPALRNAARASAEEHVAPRPVTERLVAILTEAAGAGVKAA